MPSDSTREIVARDAEDVVGRIKDAVAQVPKDAEFQCIGAVFAEARGWARLVSQLGEMQRSWDVRISASDLRSLLARVEAAERERDKAKADLDDCWKQQGDIVGRLTTELDVAQRDTARLDWLEAQGNGAPWIARQSAIGRGFRLHNSEHRDPGLPTARAAIDAARGGAV